MTLIKKDEVKTRKVSDQKTVFNYVTSDVSKNISFAEIMCKDISENVHTDYNRIYHITSGTLKVTINDDEFVAEEGDSIFINSGTGYTMTGTFKGYVINSPAFGTL